MYNETKCNHLLDYKFQCGKHLKKTQRLVYIFTNKHTHREWHRIVCRRIKLPSAGKKQKP